MPRLAIEHRESLPTGTPYFKQESKMATQLSELNQKHYHLKNLFKELFSLADQACDKLHGYNEYESERIMQDINELIEEASNNGFIELL